jgi:hypothetical protein
MKEQTRFAESEQGGIGELTVFGVYLSLNPLNIWDL